MSEISRVSLMFGKLNSLGYKAIEGATVLCKMRGNPYVELVHWFSQILQRSRTRTCIASSRSFRSTLRAWRAIVTEALDRLPGAARRSISDLSAHVEAAVEGAAGCMAASCSATFRSERVTSSSAFSRRPACGTPSSTISRELDKIKVEQLADSFDKIVEPGSPPEYIAASERRGGRRARRGERRHGAPRPCRQAGGPRRGSPSISPKRARRGEIDPVTGRRDEEIRQIVDVLKETSPEQPHPHGRGRRGQDGRRRRLRRCASPRVMYRRHSKNVYAAPRST